MKFSEKVKYFYEEIKLITEGIGKTDLSERLIEAAKEHHLDDMKLISRQFKKDNLELWGRMALFYEEYSEDEPEIFGMVEGLYEYNSNDIDPVNLCILLVLSFEKVCDNMLFKDWRELQTEVSKKGYTEIAEQMTATTVDSFDFLIAAYS